MVSQSSRLQNKNRTHKSSPRRKLVILFFAVGALVLLFAITELTGLTHVFLKEESAITGSSYTKGETATNDSETTNSTNDDSETSSKPGDNKSSTGGDTGVSIIKPSGEFVSNHHPNLSGSPAPNTITSVCTTTPGATCTISFTKDGVTKSLPPQTTDRGGSAYWNNWSLQSLGLTAGSWQVKATATLNTSSEAATDALTLEVAQ